MWYKGLLLTLFICLLSVAQAQQPKKLKAHVEKLASPAMHGRGYVKHGDRKAASYLAKQFRKMRLTPCFPDYRQPYHFSVNTFPSIVEAAVDGIALRPGVDFMIHPGLTSVRNSWPLIWVPDTLSSMAQVYAFVDTNDLQLKDQLVVVPETIKNAWRTGIPGIPAMVQRDAGRLWWHVSQSSLPKGNIRLRVSKDKLPESAKQLTINVEAVFKPEHQAFNIAGYVQGISDSMIIMVAHYDHLGMMGNKTMFPGASDNASGTAFVLDLAEHYARLNEKPRYTMVFLLVSGEEAGLMGSKYFAENPPFELQKVVFVINFDMVGSGSEGITVINAIQFPQSFALLKSINEAESLFPKVVERGESCNSDHCPFYEKGIPSFFIHTQGPENNHYHDVDDKAALLPFTKHLQLFRLITAFSDRIPAHTRTIK